jgi:hypothetical protein
MGKKPSLLLARAARWHSSKPKPPVWVNLSVLQWTMLVYFMAILSILRPFGKVCGHFGIFYVYLVHFSSFGVLYQ